MRQMPEKSVHTVITSPPYYGLRDYSNAMWEGGDPECEHEKVASGRGTNIPQTKNPGVSYPIAPHRGGDPNSCVRCGATRVEPTVWGGDPEHDHEWSAAGSVGGGSQAQGATSLRPGRSNVGEQVMTGRTLGALCDCGAWRGALGLEPTFQMYTAHLVEVFREVWRVLRDDGIAWLNLGDSYANDAKWGGASGGKHVAALHGQTGIGRQKVVTGLPPKSLIGIPWRVAFALQDDGWILRQDIVWAKPNAMPESVDDRPSRSHEFIFMLAKQPRYFYDHVAIKEPVGEAMVAAAKRKAVEPGKVYQHDEHSRMGKTSPNRVWSDPAAVARILDGRNKRDVWVIATLPYPDEHFAVFPPKLVEPMIKASTSEKGVCPDCGAPWKRVVETTDISDEPLVSDERKWTDGYGVTSAVHKTSIEGGQSLVQNVVETVGWAATCGHGCEPVPARVLDPFGGSGTTAMVAQQLGRKGILVDLNPEYSDLQLVRNKDIPLGI